jgi:hypothetical protein
VTQTNVTTGESAFLRSELEAIPGLTPRARETLDTLPLDRDTLTIMVNNLVDDTNQLEAEPYVTWDPATALLTGARLLVDGPNVTFSTTATEVSAELTDTGVTLGAYGDASHVIAVTIDAKGRIVDAQAFPLESGNVAETSKLFFTDARARAAVSGTAPISYNSGTGAFSLANSGVTPGTYASPASITVDAYGRVTAIS